MAAAYFLFIGPNTCLRYSMAVLLYPLTRMQLLERMRCSFFIIMSATNLVEYYDRTTPSEYVLHLALRIFVETMFGSDEIARMPRYLRHSLRSRHSILSFCILILVSPSSSPVPRMFIL